MLASLLLGDQTITDGLLVGSAVGLTFFAIAWWTFTVVVREKKSEQPNILMGLLAIQVFVLKFPLLGVGLWFAFKYIPINPFALVGGIAITQVAILIAGISKLFKK